MRAQFNKKKREREQAARDLARGNILDEAAVASTGTEPVVSQ